MLHLRNINPMVRAVGTMGAVSALVGGITFAQLTSNTVALSPNTLSTGSANLEIGALNNDNHHHHNNNGNDNNNNEDVTTDTTTTNNTSGLASTDNLNTDNSNNNNHNNSCRNTTNGTIPGFNLTGQNGLLPGVESDPLNFCLSNTSDVALDLTAVIPDDPFSGATTLQPEDVTLDVTCDNGGHANGTLDEFLSTATPIKTLGSLSANDTTNCEATVELNNSATISGTETLPSFDIEFTGTTSS